MAEEKNQIELIYKQGRKYATDCLNIDIKETTSGALGMFQRDLNELAKKYTIQNTVDWHPVTAAYSDLLQKMSLILESELKK